MRKLSLFLVMLFATAGLFSLQAKTVKVKKKEVKTKTVTKKKVTKKNAMAKRWYRKGAVLVYGVDYQGKKYDFKVTILNFSPDLTFDWQMTNPVNTKGKVIIKKEAFASSKAQFNYFSGGETVLEDKTSVWLSKKSYFQLKKKKATIIDSGSGDETLTLKGREKLLVKVHGVDTELNVIYAETDKGNKFWIWENSVAPVILKMNLGWEIAIREIHKPLIVKTKKKVIKKKTTKTKVIKKKTQ